jgi:hypothetical protein
MKKLKGMVKLIFALYINYQQFLFVIIKIAKTKYYVVRIVFLINILIIYNIYKKLRIKFIMIKILHF